MRIVGADEDYYLIAPQGVELNKIMQAVNDHTGMRAGSFADLQVKRIFSDLFRGAMDLWSIYGNYYIEEYDSFREFLYQREGMEYESIDSIQLQKEDTLWKLRYGINNYGVKDLIGYENENISILNHFLKGVPI